MKRICTLLLSLSFLLSLTVPALAADPTSFSDAADIGRWEAVAALSKLGVIDGKEDGSFSPKDKVTRAQAAKLIYLMGHGGKDAGEKLKAESLTDVSGHWAETYIAWCAQEEIILGRGLGAFDPDGEVTGLELAKMALVLLGYDPMAYRLVGRGWDSQVHELARMKMPISLYQDTGIENAADALDREQTAQLLYNALQMGVKTVVTFENPQGALTGSYEYKEDENGNAILFLQDRFGLAELPAPPVQPKK